MTFVRGLLAGRSHLAFLLGLGAAALTIRAVDGGSGAQTARPDPPPSPATIAPPDAPRLSLRARAVALDERQLTLARTAWSYLERNADPRTGLAPSVKGARSTTVGDVGAQLAAVLAAEDLGLVSRAAASRLLGRALASLAVLPLCEGGLPNESYDVRTLKMVDRRGAPAPRGIGWSVVDVARVLVPLSAVSWHHPELAPLARTATSRWRLESLAGGETRRGSARRADGIPQVEEEARGGLSLGAHAAVLEALAYRVRTPATGHRAAIAPAEANR